jgi:hypothetical protein
MLKDNQNLSVKSLINFPEDAVKKLIYNLL